MNLGIPTICITHISSNAVRNINPATLNSAAINQIAAQVATNVMISDQANRALAAETSQAESNGCEPGHQVLQVESDRQPASLRAFIELTPSAIAKNINPTEELKYGTWGTLWDDIESIKMPVSYKTSSLMDSFFETGLGGTKESFQLWKDRMQYFQTKQVQNSFQERDLLMSYAQALCPNDPQKELRLFAAQCAKAQLSTHLPEGHVGKPLIQAIENLGQQPDLSPERDWVNQQPESNWFKSEQGTIHFIRLQGAVQWIGGNLEMLGAIASAASCTMGFTPSCAAALYLGVTGADNAQAGYRTLISGEAQPTEGGKLLQNLGLSPDAAELLYGLTQLSPIAAEAFISRRTTIKIAEKAAANNAETIIDSTAQAVNRAKFEVYKDKLIAQMDKPIVEDSKLSKIVERLYRNNANVGSGSTAAALRNEKITGQPTKGKFHLQKAEYSTRSLEKWLSNNPAASANDRAIAENLLRDLQNALNGK